MQKYLYSFNLIKKYSLLVEKMESFRDSTKYSDGTLKTHRAIYKLVKNYGFDPYQISNSNINGLLTAIKTNDKNKRYTDSYMSIVISTLRVFNPETLTKSPASFGFNRKKNNQFVIQSGKIVPAIEKLVTFCLTTLNENFSEILNETYRDSDLTRAQTDMIVCVTLVTCTNLRVSELLQLTVLQLYNIYVGNIVSIKIKKKLKSVRISKFEPLFSNVYPLIMYAVANSLVKQSQLHKEEYSDFIANPTNSVYGLKSIITCGQDSINKKLIETYSILNSARPPIPLGLKIIRRLNTTKILKYDTPEVAAMFNRHADPTTAFKYYNIPDSETVMNSITL